MSGEPFITVCGTAGGDAEMRFLPSGVGLCSWSMAVTPRVKQGDTWSDGETVWYRCTAWRQLGESAAESVVKGMRLLVHGKLKVRTFEKDGQARTSLEIDVEHVGAEMRYATVKAHKVARSAGDTSGGSADPWSNPTGTDDEIPF